MIVDAFAGPGGWDRGAAALGLRPIGIEWGAAECLTRAAAEHLTIRADVATWPAEMLYGRLAGFICSSPCPDFSKAGKRLGLEGPTGRLVFEVLRWAEAARPRWIAAENVDDVAPIFRSFRAPLAALGYSVWTGVLDTADYGVPQNRKRAFLLASLDRRVAPPAPTHSKSGHDDLFGDGRSKWISMAEALGWGYEQRPARTMAGNRSPRWLYEDRDGTHGAVLRTGASSMVTGRDAHDVQPYERHLNRPAPTVDTQAASAWKLRTSHYTGPADDRHYHEKSVDEPAPTVVPNAGRSNWKLRHPGRSYSAEPLRRSAEQPAPAVALGHNVAEWCWERPATAVQGTPRIAPPGYRGGKAAMAAGVKERQFENSVKVELWELGVLQGFPADYPWRGNKTEQARQIGNAVPPPMAAALLGVLAGANARQAASA